jgi:Flp pilus assembly protein TadB
MPNVIDSNPFFVALSNAWFDGNFSESLVQNTSVSGGSGDIVGVLYLAVMPILVAVSFFAVASLSYSLIARGLRYGKRA